MDSDRRIFAVDHIGGRVPRLKVRIPSILYSYTNGLCEVDGRGATVDDVLRDLDARYPGLRFRIIDETDRIRRHIMIFIGTTRVASLGEQVDPGAELVIIPSISGGGVQDPTI